MNKTIRFAIAAMTLMLSQMLCSSAKSDPEGHLTYCLPSTTISLEVEAVQEKFFAGPYAKYAEKYLGVKVRQKDETFFQLTSVTMTPLVEADQSRRYSVTVSKGKIETTFLKLSAAGLVSFSDADFGGRTNWRFPIRSEGDFADMGVLSNLTSASATLYGKEKGESAFSKVAVQQDMVVAKSLEKRAAEAADMILKLRKQRLQIVTGDTDATYSGEAMGAAIEELTRLEKEYMTLFTGYSETQTQKMNFDVIPEAGRESQMYIAFRLSDSAGLVPADNLSGKPVVMEIVVSEFRQIENAADTLAVSAPKSKSKNPTPAVVAYYRIPAMCTVKLTEGGRLLLQSRMPVYQLGQESSLPVNVILK